MGACSAVLLVLVTIFLPPVGVFIVAGGCGADLLINIGLCLLGYIPGHIHAFYLEYAYFDNKKGRGSTRADGRPGIFDKQLRYGPSAYGQSGNPPSGYGTTVPPVYNDAGRTPLA